jgi:hypothetical protein
MKALRRWLKVLWECRLNNVHGFPKLADPVCRRSWGVFGDPRVQCTGCGKMLRHHPGGGWID